MICLRLHAAESRDLVINIDDDRFDRNPAVVTVHATIKKEELALIRTKIKADGSNPQDVAPESTWIHP